MQDKLTPRKAIEEAARIKALGDNLLAGCMTDADVYHHVDSVLGAWAETDDAINALVSDGIDLDAPIPDNDKQ